MSIEQLLDAIQATYSISYTIFDETQQPISGNGEVLQIQTNFFQRLIQMSQQSQTAKILIDLVNCSAACIIDQTSKHFIILGIVFIGGRSQEALYQSLKKSHFTEQEIVTLTEMFQQVPIFSLSEFQHLVAFVFAYLNPSAPPLDQKEMVRFKENNVIKQELALDIPTKFQSIAIEQEYESYSAYDIYAFERELWQCIREGDERNLQYIHKYAMKLSTKAVTKQNQLREVKNSMIACCTLATRAAIDGGLSPEIGFSLCDYYIQLAEKKLERHEIFTLMTTMFLDLTRRVHNINIIQGYSDFTRKCITYIQDHIRDEIQYDHLAEEIGITKNYMLSKFKKDTNTSMVNYIKHQKVKEAMDLLRFSDYSIAQISEILSFSSQSFFTSTFHTITGMTPKQYRNQTLGE